MNCPNCGANVDGKAFCAQCGTPVDRMAYQQPVYNAAPMPPQQAAGNPTKVLVFGIIGLALSTLGIPGLIFSIIALKQANNYMATYGDIANQVRIGRKLAIAGLIVSIICMVIWTIYFIVIIAAVANGSSRGSYYYRYY